MGLPLNPEPAPDHPAVVNNAGPHRLKKLLRRPSTVIEHLEHIQEKLTSVSTGYEL